MTTERCAMKSKRAAAKAILAFGNPKDELRHELV